MILFLDDQPSYVEAYKDALVWEGFQVRLVVSPTDFFAVLDGVGDIEAAVVDVMLRDSLNAGLLVLRRIRETKPLLPVVLLTNRHDIRLQDIGDDHAAVLCKRDTSPMDLLSVLTHLGVPEKRRQENEESG